MHLAVLLTDIQGTAMRRRDKKYQVAHLGLENEEGMVAPHM